MVAWFEKKCREWDRGYSKGRRGAGFLEGSVITKKKREGKSRV